MLKRKLISLIIIAAIPIAIFSEVVIDDREVLIKEDIHIIDKPKEDCEKTEGEKGILSTLILIYTKTRNAVKVAYDEIQYWKGLGNTYKQLKSWFSNQANYLNQVRNIATEIFTGKEDLFVKLEKAENIFDLIDHVALNESKRLDQLFCNIEYMHDQSVLIPNTDNIIEGMNRLFNSGTSTDLLDPVPNGLSDNEKQEYRESQKQYLESKNQLRDLQLDKYPEFKLVEAAKVLSSSSIANSQVYFQWAVNSIGHYNTIEEETKNLDNVNEINLYASWLSLEQVNAYNKKIRHLAEELKLYNSILAFDMWEASLKRSIEITQEESFERVGVELHK